MDTLEQYLQETDHAYAELVTKRANEVNEEKRRKDLQQSRIVVAVRELIPEALRPLVTISFHTMEIHIDLNDPFLGGPSAYVEANFTAEDWIIEVFTPWRVRLNGREIGEEAELIHAIGALRHELSKRDEEASSIEIAPNVPQATASAPRCLPNVAAMATEKP
jgi:hypothetical protein